MILIYYFNENVEFGAKWIEVVNKKGKQNLVASIYRHPHKNDTKFIEYIEKTLTRIKKREENDICNRRF